MRMQSSVLHMLKGRLAVSCQGSEGDAFYRPEQMACFAQAALTGGAAAIRANGEADIRAIRAVTDVPIIGIYKEVQPDGKILITPTFQHAQALVNAGADIVALDVTVRGQRFGAIDLVRRIKAELGVPVAADIATLEEAMQAIDAGADAVLSTLRGYTEDTAHIQTFEPQFIADLVSLSRVPVIAEGRIQSPEDAAAAMSAGAFAVIVGTAITKPQEITRRFASAVQGSAASPAEETWFYGIDLGGTNTKFGIVSSTGKIAFSSHLPTPAHGGRQAMLQHLKAVTALLMDQSGELNGTPVALGVATAGWVNTNTGAVAYATENLPGWTGTEIGRELREATNLPVFVENDANALAVAEAVFGAGKGLRNFVCITLGTGVGGGCFVNGTLNRGAHFFANAIGHMTLVADGIQCTCGKTGCLEAYTNASALLSYAEGEFQDAEQLIAAANQGKASAIKAIRIYSYYLAAGCSSVVNLLDPEALIISGGLVQNNPLLMQLLREGLASAVPAWHERSLRILDSPLGYIGGVMGAAAVALSSGIS